MQWKQIRSMKKKTTATIKTKHANTIICVVANQLASIGRLFLSFLYCSSLCHYYSTSTTTQSHLSFTHTHNTQVTKPKHSRAIWKHTTTTKTKQNQLAQVIEYNHNSSVQFKWKETIQMNPNELASKNVLINISKKEKFFFSVHVSACWC